LEPAATLLTILLLAKGLIASGGWAIGNVKMKRLPPVDTLNLVVWMSLVPPYPALALSGWMDGPFALTSSLGHAPWVAIGAVLYLGLGSTVLAYAIWSRRLRLYPTAAVTPFALLAPCVGALSPALVFGEPFGPLRLAGMSSIIVRLAIVALPLDRIATLLGFRAAKAYS
jgi:O-acetylserine/cysteine efflux transporter